MRRLIRWCVILAVLWSGWWVLASVGAHQGLSGWIAAGKNDGWAGEVRQSGFPFRIRSQLSDVVLRDPGNEVTVKAEGLTVSAPTYWPGYVTADLPETPITIQTGAGNVVIEAAKADAGVRISPGTALELDRLHAVSGAWRVSLEGQEMLRAQSLDARMEQDPAEPLRYDVALNADRLSLGKALREPLRLDLDWPSSFDAFAAALSVTFDRPLDRHAGTGAAPQPRALHLRDVDLRWGEIALAATGTLLMDNDGTPEGTIDVQLQNWRVALDLAKVSGALPPAMLSQSELVLAALANRAGSPDDLDVEVAFKDGRMRVTGIDLGPAPRIRFD